MCKEIRHYYRLCSHKSFRTFEYCTHAITTYDEQYQPTKKVCPSVEINAFQIGGLCHECGERALRAEAEALAAKNAKNVKDDRREW